MDIRIGTSGFAYPAWKGRFYPEKMKPAEMLPFYAARFDAVEINNTFYRMPKPEMLAAWTAHVPDSFRFVLKASQKITHIRRLKDTAADDLRHFWSVSDALGARRGPVLFQLPPNLKKDVERLAGFLALLPEGCRAAFEFRHESWFGDDVYDTLRASGAALCAADVDDEGRALALPSTASFGYLRLRRVEYSDGDLQAWADRIRAQPWTEAWVFFKHEDEGTGPAFASRLKARLASG